MRCARTTLLIVFLLCAGCATRRTNLIARTGGTPFPQQFQNVSLLPRASQSPAERTLETQLAAALERRGIGIVPQSESGFAIAAAFEENWDHHNVPPIVAYQTRPPAPTFMPAGAPAVVVMQPSYYSLSKSGETQIRTEGIRLRLYRTADLKQGRFQTAWEGYIEAGLASRPEQQPALLEMLCGYLGRDFIGHVKTAQ